MSIQDVTVQLNLRWGLNSTRMISFPIEIRKGSYSQRYECYVDGVHVGWVVKHRGLWEAYLSVDQGGGGGKGWAAAESTRTLAIDWLGYRLGEHARTNILAARAEAAYADEIRS